MSVSLDSLPSAVGDVCRALRDRLQLLLGDELVALWLYGAVCFEDRPVRLNDLDTHGFLRSNPPEHVWREIDEIHKQTAAAHGIEWDSWYILEGLAAQPEPPAHAFRDELSDRAWALHRAHWLSGRFAPLLGALPSQLIAEPTWAELATSLRAAVDFVERILGRPPPDAQTEAFVVWQASRIIYSITTRDVVISKRAAAAWALDNLPGRFHEAIRAAGRVYDGAGGNAARVAMQASMSERCELARAKTQDRAARPEMTG